MTTMFPLVCLTVLLAAVTFGPIQCKELDLSVIPLEQTREERSADRVRTILHPKGGFLAGEDTPVWLAYRKQLNSSTYTYTKLEKGIVKKAINYWKSDEFQGISRKPRSVDDQLNFLEDDLEDSVQHEINNRTKSSSRTVKRRKRQDQPIVYHPSILAVMEYDGEWPSDEKAQEKLVMEKILYALAFWNGVDLQFRPIDEPRVRMRLSGIVIGRDKEATKHLMKYRDPVVFDYQASLENVLDYWGVQVRKSNKDFRKGAYNIIGLMTDALPADDYVLAASTHGPPCDYEVDEYTGGLVVFDDLAFNGLQRAVHMMARILGQGTDNGKICTYQRDWNSGRTWDKCDLDVIRQSLDNNGWCLAVANEYHKPGRPVEAILPGRLMPATNQCKSRGWEHGIVCSINDMSCDYLRCSNDHWYSTCGRAGEPLDGSECFSGMICLHGECVINSTLTYT